MLSILPAVHEKFRAQYANAPVDIASFHRRYKACGMGECHGLCCNGGSGFHFAEESEAIRSAVAANQDFFGPRGITVDNAFDKETDEETGETELSTNTREVSYPEGFLPAHFPATACVFRDANSACSLQMLGLSQGKDGWHYKPLACWLFPIELERGGKSVIHVAHHSTDDYIGGEGSDYYPGFVGFTKCGAECTDGGKPAYEILQKEIAALSEWLGRDLLSEILAEEKQEQVA